MHSERVVGKLEGHKMAVTSIASANGLIWSASFDKTIKGWDLRMSNCVSTTVTGSPLWSLIAVKGGLIAGGENGVMGIYSI